MKKKIATIAIVAACIVSVICNQGNLQTIKAAAEIKNGAQIGAYYAYNVSHDFIIGCGE